MENTPEVHADKKPRSKYIAAIPNVFAYGISTAVGGFIADREIKLICYEKLKKEGVFDKIINEPRHAERVTKWSEFERTPNRTAGSVFHDITKKFEDAKAAEFKKRGFKNTMDYARMLSTNDRIDAAERIGTVTGIVLGALLLIANSKPIAKIFSGRDQDDNSQCR